MRREHSYPSANVGSEITLYNVLRKTVYGCDRSLKIAKRHGLIICEQAEGLRVDR